MLQLFEAHVFSQLIADGKTILFLTDFSLLQFTIQATLFIRVHTIGKLGKSQFKEAFFRLLVVDSDDHATHIENYSFYHYPKNLVESCFFSPH